MSYCYNCICKHSLFLANNPKSSKGEFELRLIVLPFNKLLVQNIVYVHIWMGVWVLICTTRVSSENSWNARSKSPSFFPQSQRGPETDDVVDVEGARDASLRFPRSLIDQRRWESTRNGETEGGRLNTLATRSQRSPRKGRNQQDCAAVEP